MFKDVVFLESVRPMPLMSLPVRSIFVPLQRGKLLISPGTRLTRQQLQSVERVTDIIAPNLFHCEGVLQAASIFSGARKWGVEGAKQLKANIVWTDDLREEAWPYQDDLPMIEIHGMPKVNECVFFHKGSKSLIVTDLCFNLMEARGLGSRLILSLFGTFRQFGVSKFFIQFVADKSAFEASLGRIFALDFNNIILSHGANIIGGGKDLLRGALQKRGFTPK